MSLKRQTEILQIVRSRGSYSISELASRMAVSTETIRRNIQPLIDSGALLRFHGGIMAPEATDEPPFQRRMQVNSIGKRAVAALVRGRVQDGDSLILDNGTTSAYVADALSGHSRLTVVTHSVEIAHRLAGRNGNRVFLAGGELGEDGSALGLATIDFIRQFQVRYAMISVGGVTLSGEFGDFHLHEAEFARAAIEQAQEAWVIADLSKFGREAPVRVCGLSQVDAVAVDGRPPAGFAERCREEGVRLLTTDPVSGAGSVAV